MDEPELPCYCDEYVCSAVHSRISETTRLNVTKFFVHVACSRGAVLLGWCCDMLYTSVFVDSGVARIWCDWGAKLNEHQLWHKMTQYNSHTMNRVYVAVTELHQLKLKK